MVVNEKILSYVGIRRKVDLASLAETGLTKEAVNALIAKTKLHPSQVFRYLDITSRTFQNYLKKQPMRVSVADRVIDLAKLYAHGEKVFGSVENFNYWLQHPSVDFNGKSPLEYIRSRHGLEEVDRVVGKIEHGIPA